MDVQAWLAERGAAFERFLDAALPAPDAPPAALHVAMRHLIFPNGGKRLRPALAAAACEAAGRPAVHALPVAAAVELVHTYSLIHDDLPCMDDDAERRGRPAVHVAHGEALAVLAGDALLARAFGVLADAAAEGEPECALFALRELARAAGSHELVGGQALDLDFRGSDAAAVEAVHARKTAALFRAAVLGGARYGGATPTALARFARFGEKLGVAFQIADDLLDREADEPCSWLRVGSADAARARLEVLLDEALAALGEFGERAEPLRELARLAVGRRR